MNARTCPVHLLIYSCIESFIQYLISVWSLPDTVGPEGPCPWPLSHAASQPMGCLVTHLLHACQAPAMSQSPDQIRRCRTREHQPCPGGRRGCSRKARSTGPLQQESVVVARLGWRRCSAGVRSPEPWRSPLWRPGHQGHQPRLAELITSPGSHALADRVRPLPQELQPTLPEPHPCSSTCCPQPLAEMGASLCTQESLGDHTGHVPTTRALPRSLHLSL